MQFMHGHLKSYIISIHIFAYSPVTSVVLMELIVHIRTLNFNISNLLMHSWITYANLPNKAVYRVLQWHPTHEKSSSVEYYTQMQNFAWQMLLTVSLRSTRTPLTVSPPFCRNGVRVQRCRIRPSLRRKEATRGELLVLVREDRGHGYSEEVQGRWEQRGVYRQVQSLHCAIFPHQNWRVCRCVKETVDSDEGKSYIKITVDIICQTFKIGRTTKRDTGHSF